MDSFRYSISVRNTLWSYLVHKTIWICRGVSLSSLMTLSVAQSWHWGKRKDIEARVKTLSKSLHQLVFPICMTSYRQGKSSWCRLLPQCLKYNPKTPVHLNADFHALHVATVNLQLWFKPKTLGIQIWMSCPPCCHTASASELVLSGTLSLCYTCDCIHTFA